MSVNDANKVDIIVIGLGIAGMSTLYSLAKKDSLKCLGIEQNGEKSLGSSRGPSRITRKAYWKDYDI